MRCDITEVLQVLIVCAMIAFCVSSCGGSCGRDKLTEYRLDIIERELDLRLEQK
jgi:hypothetical protein